MFGEIAFNEFDFVDDRDVIEEPIEEETNLAQDSEYFEDIVLIVKQYFNDLLILDDAFEESKQLPGIFD